MSSNAEHPWTHLEFHVFPVVFESGLDGFVSLGVASLACVSQMRVLGKHL